MSNVNLINYSTREFMTKGEMDSYIRKQDEIFTSEVTEIFINAGMLRRVVTQIWNKEGVFTIYPNKCGTKVKQDCDTLKEAESYKAEWNKSHQSFMSEWV